MRRRLKRILKNWTRRSVFNLYQEELMMNEKNECDLADFLKEKIHGEIAVEKTEEALKEIDRHFAFEEDGYSYMKRRKEKVVVEEDSSVNYCVYVKVKNTKDCPSHKEYPSHLIKVGRVFF